jgi:hypothetical protein
MPQEGMEEQGMPPPEDIESLQQGLPQWNALTS